MAGNDHQGELFDTAGFSQESRKQAFPKKLKIDNERLSSVNEKSRSNREVINGIPPLDLPTRWEILKPKVDNHDVSLNTIIQPVPGAISEVRNIAEYLRTTGGCQVLVIRGNTGSGKTTFLNTLNVYMTDVMLNIISIDIESIDESSFYAELEKIEVDSGSINVCILEGREKPESTTDRYIQILLSNINRYSRAVRVPLLFVIPTIDEKVARNWCNHGAQIGDLIPDSRMHEGSRWYTFPGVSKSKYKSILEDTVLALNPQYGLYDFGVSSSDIDSWAENSQTIGEFIETFATRVSRLRGVSLSSHEGRRKHVWVVFCCPDLRHSDHTYLVVDSLCGDDKLRASATKLVPPSSKTAEAKHWKAHPVWARFIATINYLDVRLINLPISTLVTAALTYCDDEILQSFKDTSYSQYRDKIPQEMIYLVDRNSPIKSDEPIYGAAGDNSFDWNQPLTARRLQVQNARDSIQRTNLFYLLRGMPAEEQKGGQPESVYSYIRYLHLREKVSEERLHLYIGLALKEALENYGFQDLIGVETEAPIVRGESSPQPDITIHTEREIYALEFHFRQTQITPSEAARYSIKNVVRKYMENLSYLRSMLDRIE
ncbi:MAG: hypothetical protein WBG32_18395 [Nodosilinea sp.]